MTTTAIGRTRFKFNSDLSGKVTINNNPAVKALQSIPYEEITVPMKDVVEFVLRQLIDVSIDSSRDILEDTNINVSDKVESMTRLAYLVDGMQNLSADFGHGVVL